MLKSGHFRWEKNKIIIHYLSVNCIIWFQQKKLILAFFFKFRVLSVRPLLVVLDERELLVVRNFITMGGMVGAGLLHLVVGTLHPKI